MSEPLNWKAPDRSPAHTEAAAKKTTLEVEVRARYLRKDKDDPALYDVQLVEARTESAQQAQSVSQDDRVWLRFRFVDVAEGWHRLGVTRRSDGAGEIDTRAFRDIRVVTNPAGEKQVERVELLPRKRAWCCLSAQVLGHRASGYLFKVRYPDGLTRGVVADEQGEVWLEGLEQEVFVLLAIESPDTSSLGIEDMD